ncbi:guanine nucleotide-binding protein g(o) subunit alpha [Anaeramoeba flamelloides]|uniref:Guanine nucleotide-binding protein g(O) subunit alpha n=1 Tax=Anaeramoeba flamelloides TaxID=1746091 RepID=A0AAV8ABV2_9EUKA|nr:guanine nucleotide-binding protein g(o) subunit alpha [Anaeramoeba flamelloides]KAJ6253748.1 guanine nucleotide-binding protein g(o) subunit alpha [Anaeramoeba flamelloides]
MGNKKNRSLQAKLKRNREIEQEIMDDEAEMDKEIKILVLGTGDSGKTTFLKQVQILFKDGFTENDQRVYRNVIRGNLISDIKTLIQACNDLQLEISSKNEEIADELLDLKDIKNGKIEPYIYDMITDIWKEQVLKTAFKRRSEFQIPDSSHFYFEKIDEIRKDDYVPNERDILNCRIPTSGVKVLSYEVNGYLWKIVDVGGQRSERRKWIHQFDDVSLIIYVTAISEYDQKLYEQDTVNRLHESLALFEKTVNNNYFKKKNCVLLFNKFDLFQKKIKKIDLKVCFRKYKGGCNEENALNFITKKFIRSAKKGKKRVYHHYTVGTKTKDIENVFGIVNKALKKEFSKL